MIIRNFQESDQKSVEEIIALYWTDPEFLEEVSGKMRSCGKEIARKGYGFIVAEERGEIVGISGFKELDDYLKPYATTDKPVEFYILAVKQKRKGVGEKLKQKQIEEVQKLGFSEILLYSPNSHKESWHFHDRLGFKRAGEVTPPDDGAGQVWRKVL